MKKYQVKVMAYMTIEVVAEDEYQAQDKALESDECSQVIYHNWDTEVLSEKDVEEN